MGRDDLCLERPAEHDIQHRGAQWTPTVVFASQDATSEFLETFRRAARIANRAFQLMVGPTYGVLWIDNYALSMRPRNATNSTTRFGRHRGSL